jgi:hypothetical protein
MEISVTWPGQRATDPRNTVTLREAGTPWPIRFHFLRLGDTEKPDWVELVNVGFEIGERFEVGQLETIPDPVDAVALQRIASSYGSYLEIARQALVLDREGTEGAINRLRGPGRKPARLTDDFYRLIAAEYETHRQAGGHPGKELAAKYSTHPGNVSKWLKEARARGYIKRYEIQLTNPDGTQSSFEIERGEALEVGKPFTQGTMIYRPLRFLPGRDDVDAVVEAEQAGGPGMFVEQP